jgi:asparagine synthase (glutamine-hydrolysing)
VERFRELFDQAVSDRLRTNRVGILMSGGLDSTSVAATAKKVSQQSGKPVELTAHPVVYDRLVSHPERHYAEIAAKGMEMPIHCFVADDYSLFDGWEEGELHFSEPVNNPLALSGLHHLRGIAQGARVVLTGFGGDPALSSRISRHVRGLARQRRYGRLALDVGRYLAAEGRLSRLYLGGRFRRLSSRRRPGIFPEWLNPELEKRLDLRTRWQSFTGQSPAEGAVRPEAHSALHSPVWSYTFEGLDAGATGVALEARHPFFDLRLLRYLLSLPALPWCSDKEILRVAMKSHLPEQVRLRRKTPMVNHPYVALRKDVATTLQERFFPVPELTRFVRPERLFDHIDNDQTNWIGLVATLRPVSLNFWLKTLSALA